MKVKAELVKTNKGKIAKMAIDRENGKELVSYYVMVADYLNHFPLVNRFVITKSRNDITYYIYRSGDLNTVISATDKLRKAKRIIASKAIDNDIRYPVNKDIQSYTRGLGVTMDISEYPDKECAPVNVKPNAHLYTNSTNAGAHCKVGYGPSLNYDKRLGK